MLARFSDFFRFNLQLNRWKNSGFRRRYALEPFVVERRPVQSLYGASSSLIITVTLPGLLSSDLLQEPELKHLLADLLAALKVVKPGPATGFPRSFIFPFCIPSSAFGGVLEQANRTLNVSVLAASWIISAPFPRNPSWPVALVDS